MNKNIKTNVVRNTFYNLISSFVTKIFSLIFVIIVARLYQPEIFGMYNLAISVAMILLVLADLGINNTLIRYVSANVKDKKKQLIYFRYLMKLKFILTVFMALLLIILSKPLAVHVFKKPELFYPLLFSSLYLIVSSFTDIISSLFDAFSEFQFKLWKEIIWQSGRLIFSVGLFIFVLKNANAPILALVLCTLITLLFVFFIAKKRYVHLFSKITETLSKEEIKKLLKYVLFISISAVSYVFFTQIDIIMIGMFLPAEYAGYYRAAFGLILTASVSIPFSAVLFPLFSRLSLKQTKPLFEKVLRVSFIFSMPLAFGLAIFAELLIKLIYGVAYLPAILPLYILSCLVIIFPFLLYTFLFNARGKPEIPTKAMVLSTLINIILNYALIRYMLTFGGIYAMAGAAIATVISNIYFYYFIAYKAKKQFDIRLNWGIFLKPLFASLIMAAFLIWFNKFIASEVSLKLLGIILAGILYFLVLFLIKGFRKSDVYLIKELKK